MIKFENTEVIGWEHAIRGMRNPMNSWEKSDSGSCTGDKCFYTGECWNPSYQNQLGECPLRVFDETGNSPMMKMEGGFNAYIIGENDMNLMKRLRNAGTDHRKFMRMIVVYTDVTAPLYWWKEFDTYKVGTVANSCSTMHKIAAKKFTLDDFSCEHLFNDIYETHLYAYNIKENADFKGTMELVIDILNNAREWYLETKDKKYWWQMIQLLPSSYNQKRTVMMNYEVLANIYKSRKNHKLDEWSENIIVVDGEEFTNKWLSDDEMNKGFCDWIKTLPYSELITGEFKEDK